MESLLLKLFLAPLLVVISTLAGRRWGPHIAGTLVSFPIVAGPILFISYQQYGAEFASDAARSTLLGLVSLATFALLFAHTARRFGWLTTLVVTWTAVLAVDAALSLVRIPMLIALAITLIATAAAVSAMPKTESEHSSQLRRSAWLRWELLSRAIATGILVLVVTSASHAMGPHWTGLLAPFPIATTVIAAFAHSQYGPTVTARTLAGAAMGLFSFAAFCICLAVFLRLIGGMAFAVGAAAAVAVQVMVTLVRRTLRKRQLRVLAPR